ncbi:hypothetical protein BDF21DRAFT_455596 [Thamnidium elegans]|nr:hypothetical protein BDF21DRAFT_455596 [Thamnidium elegans]
MSVLISVFNNNVSGCIIIEISEVFIIKLVFIHNMIIYMFYININLKYDRVLESVNVDSNSITETIRALEPISLACSIATQYTISDQELQVFQNLINIWLDFYKKYIPKEQFNINIHYLTHVVGIIKTMGPLRHISCRSMERRIQRMKRRINSTTNPEKNVENISIDEAYKDYNIRSIGSNNNTGTNTMSGNFKKYHQLEVSMMKSKSLKASYSVKKIGYLTAQLLYLQKKTIYQNVTVSNAGIPFCSLTERNNQSDINECSVLEVIDINDLMVTVAAMKSNLIHANRIYFFWPGMKRANIELGEYDYEWNIDYID